MSGDVSQYLEAQERLKQAEAAVDAVAKAIVAAGKAVQNWRNAKVTVANSNFEFPPELASDPGRTSIDARTWPTAETIAKALLEYHSAKYAAESAFNAVSEDDWVALTPPSKA